ncbi:MAG: hypothetical protein ACTS3R_09025 [Inquilinaceae bacterium]
MIETPPAIRVLNLADALVAAAQARALSRPLTLISAPGAGAYAGAGWFAALTAALRADFPDVAVTAILDCGALPGPVLAALRVGIGDILHTGDDGTAAALESMATATGARLWRRAGPVLDIHGRKDAAELCRRWLEEV